MLELLLLCLLGTMLSYLWCEPRRGPPVTGRARGGGVSSSSREEGDDDPDAAAGRGGLAEGPESQRYQA